MLFGGTLMRAVFGPLQDAAKIDLRISDVQMGIVQGLGTGGPIALLSVPIAWFIDHGNRKRLLVVLMLLCVGGTFWTSFVHSLPGLFMSRTIGSLGALAAISVVISMAADMSTRAHRGKVLLLLSLGVWAGLAAAVAVGGTLFDYFDHHADWLFGPTASWREAHIVVAFIGAVLVAPVLVIREPGRHEIETHSTSVTPALRALWAKKQFLAPLFVGQLGVVMAETAAGIWSAPVLIRDYHQTPGQFAGWVGGAILFSGILGSAIGAVSADRGQRSGKRGALLYGAVMASVVAIPVAFFPIMPTLTGFAILFTLVMLCGTIHDIVSSIAVTVMIPNEERGICMALFGIVRSIIGFSLAPLLVTWGSLALGGESHLAFSLAIVGAVTGVLSLAGYALCVRHAPIVEPARPSQA
nr:MFS transporter [Sphingomonas chungangi]